MAPATVSSSKPYGVFGASKDVDRKIAGSRPMFTETGSPLPCASALARNASMCRLGAKKIDSSSRPCTHMRWMVTSVPSSGSLPSSRPRQKYGPASMGVFVGAGSRVRRSKPGSSARCTTSWQAAFSGPTSTGGIGLASACPMRWVSSRGGQSSSMPTRSRLAMSPTSTRQPG